VSKNPRDRIERTVRLLLKRCGILAPPIPLERLVTELGADLRIDAADKALRGFFVDAKLRKKGPARALVFINSAHPLKLQRMTLAHEIAHLLFEGKAFHLDAGVSRRDPKSKEHRGKELSDEERLADAFAAELLMPKHLLVADLKGKPVPRDDDDTLKVLASRYAVGLNALTSRLRQTGLLEPAF